MQRIYKSIKYLVAIATLTCVGSCTKLVDIPAPKDLIAENNVFNNDETATSVLTGIYTSMAFDAHLTGPQSMALLTGLAADELSAHKDYSSLVHLAYYANALSANSNQGSEFWSPLYNYIYKCNAALEGLANANNLTPSIKQQLIGETKFLRAFFYFYLTNLFGDVPLPTTTDYKINTQLSRAARPEVYQLIIDDLIHAAQILTPEYLDGSLQPYVGTIERVRPTKWAAKALLARVYLYINDYVNAEAEATSVINNSSVFALSPLTETFLINNPEAIWQLQPVIMGHNTEDAWTLIIPSNGVDGEHPLYLSQQLLSYFETNDNRKVEWIDSVTVLGSTYYYPFKYKSATIDDPVTEYLMVLRLAEQFLIRAEARAHLTNLAGAAEDLNAIRTRAGLINSPAATQDELISAILQERRVELFTEWGHRWLDLKRTNTIDEVMSIATPLKASGANWESYKQFFPLPLNDLQSAPNLQQNPGY